MNLPNLSEAASDLLSSLETILSHAPEPRITDTGKDDGTRYGVYLSKKELDAAKAAVLKAYEVRVK
jgi:hypothetical protein